MPAGEHLYRAVLKRFEAWATSLDPDPAHTHTVTQFSLEIYDALQREGLIPERKSGMVTPRDLLQVAALTHGSGRDAGEKAWHKVSGRLLQKLEVPPGWSVTDLLIAALVSRYHRGALPTTQKRYAALSPEDQHLVDCLGGILRLAVSLDSEGDHAIRAITVIQSNGGTDIIADGYVPRSKQAEKIAAARHLLEYAFDTALLVRESSDTSWHIGNRTAEPIYALCSSEVEIWSAGCSPYGYSSFLDDSFSFPCRYLLPCIFQSRCSGSGTRTA